MLMIASPSSTDSQDIVLAIPVSEKDHIKGNPLAKVTLVEYGDFQCPACRVYAPTVKNLSTEFGDQLRVVYRHFPLVQHKQAPLAGQASEAAALQGKFWEMHDILYEKQNEWAGKSDAEEKFAGYATSLGLDVEKFKQDMKSNDTKKKIEDDFDGGLRSGMPQGTPTFFFQDKRINTPRTYEEFEKLINKALAQTNS